ncbi:spermidine synthase [Pseudactinotalea sp.]|uniref:spermidine synthase n=1 Tax=Pseudactinotalea sp. TaxID=1926260 RepID=UPI003B3A8350
MSVIARATSPRGEVALSMRDGGVLELRVAGTFVMDTQETSSERALARVVLDGVSHPGRVLVGGLGLGFTTAEVLSDERVQQVDVVEIEQAVVDWMTDGTVPHGPDLLADPRLSIHVTDVLTHLGATARASYDVVLLDVDNGPGQLVHLPNQALYGRGGLALVRRALRPGGSLVVWSAHPAHALETELRTTIGSVRTVRIPVRLASRDVEYWVYAATR